MSIERCACGQPKYDPLMKVTVEDEYVSITVDGMEVLKVYEKIGDEWKIHAKVGYMSYHTEGFMKPATLPETICEVCKR